jgi:hypothetical protein
MVEMTETVRQIELRDMTLLIEKKYMLGVLDEKGVHDALVQLILFDMKYETDKAIKLIRNFEKMILSDY